MKNKSNYLRPSSILAIILALALTLRLLGITHGFPFIFHSDEPTVVSTALSIRFYLNPGHFDWPHLYMYINFALYMGFAVLRNVIVFLELKPFVASALPILWNDELIYYLITRVFTAVIGALTLVPVYIGANIAFGKRVGILSALAFAIIPFHVWHSHYALIDVPMLFFVACGLVHTLKILKQNDARDYAGAGFYIGLAASTKYNGALTLLTIPLAHILRLITQKEKLTSIAPVLNLVLAGLMSCAGFLLGTPYAALDADTFLRDDGPKGAMWQFKNVGTVDAGERLSEFFGKMTTKVADDFGYTMLISFFLMFGLMMFRAFTKKQSEDNSSLWFLIISGLFLLAYVSGVSRSRSHYYFVAYPYVAIVFAYFANMLLRLLESKSKALAFVIFVFLFGIPLYMSTKYAFIFSRPDSRVELYNWLKATVTDTDLLVNNKNSLSPVVAKFNNPKKKGEPGRKNLAPGYLMVAYEEICNCNDFPVSIYGGGLKKIAHFSNDLKFGPQIDVYSFNK